MKLFYIDEKRLEEVLTELSKLFLLQQEKFQNIFLKSKSPTL